MRKIGTRIFKLTKELINMSQFIKTYTTFLQQGCKPNQTLLLSMIADRMQSSRQRFSFYDKAKQDYFVIYTYEELSQNLNLSESTIQRLINKSVADGYLDVKLKNKRVNLIFLTAKSKQILGSQNDYLDESALSLASSSDNKSNASHSEKVGSQNDCLIRLNNHTNTDITVVTNKTTQKPKQPKTVQVANSTIINNLINTLRQRVNLSENIMNIIQKHFNSAAQIYSIMGLLFKAKAKASAQLNEKLRFEDNDVTALIENNLYNILLHAKNNKKIKNQNAYIYKALLKMFINSYGDVASDDVNKQPVHHRFNRAYNGHKPRIKKQPDWMQPGYQAPEMSDEEYAQYQAKIDCLMKKLALK